ncbi:MAG: 3-hydroxyacyl-CoA dehydrogenase, partial [Alphaproteobacteria bacterium]|nr:3-hydroxyacyl-CoA dehydrogenase [Alphaproteobacteria bacterium]
MTALPTDAVVAVIGAGTMGSGIAQVAAQAGHQVLLHDERAGAAEQAIAQTGKALDGLVAKGKIKAEQRQAIIDRLRPAAALKDLSAAGLVIEAVVEDLAVKQALFADLESITAPGAILATNTSSLSIGAIGRNLKAPGRFLGMHFFNPAPILPLVEVVSGLATDPAAAATVHDTAAAWGKTPVHAKSTPGFIVNRCARPFYAEALRLLGEGAADPATIDAAMRESGGFRMGPCELMDLIGHDVNFAVTRSVHAAFFGDPRYAPSVLQQELVESGRLGKKSGRGFYDYAKDAPPPDPRTAGQAPRPRRVAVRGDLGAAQGLVGRIEKSGLPLTRIETKDHRAAIIVDGAVLRLTDGLPATLRG